MMDYPCETCKYGDYDYIDDIYTCEHEPIAECHDCKVCDPEERVYDEDSSGMVTKCCMYSERYEEVDEGRPYDKYRDDPRYKEYPYDGEL